MEFLRTLLRRTVIIVPLAITFTSNVASIAGVQGRSMQPTLNPDGVVDTLLLEKWSSRKHAYRRGDVVVLWSPDEPTVPVVKRIVALEGDVVKTLTYKDKLVRVPRGHCWVEGDNHEHSKDSNTFGPVPLALIDARAKLIVWPPSRAGKLVAAYDPERISHFGRAGRD